MQTIEIDFEVFQELTAQRRSEGDSPNDLLRRLLNIRGAKRQPAPGGPAHWSCRGGSIPIGARLRSRYKGKIYEALVTDHGIEYEGRKYGSPSEAAGAVTSTNVNGWRFWQFQLPGATSWRDLSELRRDA